MARLPPQRSAHASNASSNSDGQRFLDFLTRLGYTSTSKDTEKPQYFEYLFQNDNPTRTATVRELMKKLTLKNVIDASEVESFEQLKKEGQVLYGKDLEDAVDRRTALDQRWSDKKSQKMTEKEALRQLIAKKKSEVEELKVTRNNIRSFEEQLQDKPVVKVKLDRESKDLNVVLDVTRKRLNKRMSTVKGLSNDSADSLNSFVPQDSNPDAWKSVLQKEDKLYRNTKRLIEENIAHLIMQASELESNDKYQQDLTKEFLSVVNEHAENLERLKHSIIYENVRASELKLKLDYLEEEEKQIEACLKESIRMFQKQPGFNIEEYWAKLGSVGQNVYAADADLSQKREEFIGQIRNNARLRINEELKHLVNIQAPARNRLYNFFSSIYAIVEPQKIRLDLVCNIVANARNQELGRQRQLREFTSQSQELQMELDVFAGTLDAKRLNKDGEILFFLASERGVSNADLRFFSSSIRALQNVTRQSEYRNWEENMQRVDETRDPNLKQLNRKYAQLLETRSNLYSTEVDKYLRQKEIISSAENRLNEEENALVAVEDAKHNLISDSIAKKMSMLDLMKKALRE